DTNHMYSIHTAAEVESDDRTEMQRVLDAVFYRGAERPPMPLAEERESIAAARAGDSQSFVALALSYAPVLRKAAEPYRDAESLWEDTVETVAVGLWQAIVDFKADKHDRLGAVLQQSIKATLNKDRDPLSTALNVPGQTLRLVNQIERRVEETGESVAAVIQDMRSSRWMITEDTYWAVQAARGAGELAVTDDPEVESELTARDEELAHRALAHVDPLKAEVCRWYYGFNTPEPILSDAEVAYRMNVEALGEEAVKGGQSVIYGRKVQRLR